MWRFIYYYVNQQSAVKNIQIDLKFTDSIGPQASKKIYTNKKSVFVLENTVYDYKWIDGI